MNPDWKVADLNELPPRWFLERFEHDPRAAVCVFRLMAGEPEDTRRPPKMNMPFNMGTCRVCAILAYSVIFADLRQNPRNLSLNYYKTQRNVTSRKINGITLMLIVGFVRSANGRQLKWKNNQENRDKVRYLNDKMDHQNQSHLLTTRANGTQLCRHWIDKAEAAKCGACSVHLIIAILESIHKKKSLFSKLDYVKVKQQLNGSRIGLELMFHIGFVRSANGRRFHWEDTEQNRENVSQQYERWTEDDPDYPIAVCSHKKTTAQDIADTFENQNFNVQDRRDVRPWQALDIARKAAAEQERYQEEESSENSTDDDCEMN